MSHFIISWNSVFIFGAPNGQASTQLLQAMQRGLSAVCTTPSPVRLIASAGQTSAQVGESQCMQTTGTVCGELRRSTGSMKNSADSGTGMSGALGFLEPHGADLVLGDLRGRVLGGDR